MRMIEIVLVVATVLALVIATYVTHCRVDNRVSDPQELETVVVSE